MRTKIVALGVIVGVGLFAPAMAQMGSPAASQPVANTANATANDGAANANETNGSAANSNAANANMANGNAPRVEIYSAGAPTTDLNMSGYQAFDQFAQEHPEILRQLRHRPRLVNDPFYVKKHPEFAQFLKDNPKVAEDLAENPGNYLAGFSG